jgi:hypothetical protein
VIDPKTSKFAGYLFVLAGLLSMVGAYMSNQVTQYGVGVIFIAVGAVFLRKSV